MKYVEITAVNGVRNDVAPERFAPGDLMYARNVDIDESGKATRRAGTQTIIPGPAHSVWSNGSIGFMVQGDTLYTFTVAGQKNPIAQVSGRRVCYLDVNGQVYWTDGVQSGVYFEGHSRKWGAADIEPTAEEDPEAYVFTRDKKPTTSGRLEGLKPDSFASPPPPGQVLGYFRGRVYVGTENFLVYSRPFDYERFDLRNDFFAFDAPVQTFAAVDDGIFVGTRAQTLFISGEDPAKASQKVVLPYGGVLGTEQYIGSGELAKPNSKDEERITGGAAIWMGPRGPVIGKSGGVVEELTAKRFLPPYATSGAAFLKRQNGSTHYVSSLFSER